VHEPSDEGEPLTHEGTESLAAAPEAKPRASGETRERDATGIEGSPEPVEKNGNLEEGPVHRPLIRATLPRPEGAPPPTRPAPEFTVRQPAGRQGRFRPRDQRGSSPFRGNRSGNVAGGGGAARGGGGRPQMMSRSGKRHGPGRKRSK
jgi:hypothetical protein